MPGSVVDSLEMVRIDHHDRQVLAQSLRSRKLLLSELEEMRSIDRAGQMIGREGE